VNDTALSLGRNHLTTNRVIPFDLLYPLPFLTLNLPFTYSRSHPILLISSQPGFLVSAFHLLLSWSSSPFDAAGQRKWPKIRGTMTGPDTLLVSTQLLSLSLQALNVAVATRLDLQIWLQSPSTSGRSKAIPFISLLSSSLPTPFSSPYITTPADTTTHSYHDSTALCNSSLSPTVGNQATTATTTAKHYHPSAQSKPDQAARDCHL